MGQRDTLIRFTFPRIRQHTRSSSHLLDTHKQQRPLGVLSRHLEGETLHHGLLNLTNIAKGFTLLYWHDLGQGRELARLPRETYRPLPPAYRWLR